MGVIDLEKSVCSIIGLYPVKYCVKSFWKTQSFSWNTSLSLRVIWNNLLKDFQYLLLVKSCHPLLLTVAVSNPTPQLVTDATHFAWIGLFYEIFHYSFEIIPYSEYPICSSKREACVLVKLYSWSLQRKLLY